MLGVFTERRSEGGVVRLDAGAELNGTGRGIYLCYRGSGRVGGEPLAR